MSTTRLFWNLTRLCPRCGYQWDARGKVVDQISCPDCKARLSRYREKTDGMYENIGILSMEWGRSDTVREYERLDREQRSRKRAVYKRRADAWEIHHQWNDLKYSFESIAKKRNTTVLELQELLVSEKLAHWVKPKPPVPAQTA